MFYKSKISKININHINLFNIFKLKNLKHEKFVLSKLRKFLNIKNNMIFLGRARTGIYLLVKHYLKDIKSKNNVVLTSAYTIPDIINLIKKGGGKPVFVDFDYNSTYFSINDLKKKITKYKPKILLITHYHLEDKNFIKIINICKKNKIIILEDRAISYGSIKKKNFLSDGFILSFSSFKLLNFYFGGALVCKNNKIFKKIQSEVLEWKNMSFFQYFKQLFLTHLFQLITSKFIFNYFGFYLLNYKFFLKKKIKLKRFYFSDANIDKSYFTRPLPGFFNEMKNKIKIIRDIQKHRVMIFSTYYKYLKKLSVPQNILKSQILYGSCCNFLIYHKKAKFIHNELLRLNYDTGRLWYENLNSNHPSKKKKIFTRNLDDLSKNLLVLPTHKQITKDYASNMAKIINKIALKQNENN